MVRKQWVRTSFSINPEVLRRTQDYRFTHQIDSVSQTVERLLTIALTAEEKRIERTGYNKEGEGLASDQPIG